MYLCGIHQDIITVQCSWGVLWGFFCLNTTITVSVSISQLIFVVVALFVFSVHCFSETAALPQYFSTEGKGYTWGDSVYFTILSVTSLQMLWCYCVCHILFQTLKMLTLWSGCLPVAWWLLSISSTHASSRCATSRKAPRSATTVTLGPFSTANWTARLLTLSQKKLFLCLMAFCFIIVDILQCLDCWMILHNCHFALTVYSYTLAWPNLFASALKSFSCFTFVVFDTHSYHWLAR